MTELTTAWMLGFVCGFFMGVTVARFLETLRRFRDPVTPRPRYWRNVYQPRPQGGPTNPPPRNP